MIKDYVNILKLKKTNLVYKNIDICEDYNDPLYARCNTLLVFFLLIKLVAEF
jgi:hypothetical protein